MRKVKELVDKTLKELLTNGTFEILISIYDDINFGDIFIELKSNTKVGVRFIKDKDTSWCEIGLGREWFFLEDIISYLNIKKMMGDADFIEMVTQSLKVLEANLEKIVKACDKKSIKELNDISIKRAMGMFKENI